MLLLAIVCFLHHYCLQVLYTTNLLIVNVFSFLCYFIVFYFFNNNNRNLLLFVYVIITMFAVVTEIFI